MTKKLGAKQRQLCMTSKEVTEVITEREIRPSVDNRLSGKERVSRNKRMPIRLKSRFYNSSEGCEVWFCWSECQAVENKRYGGRRCSEDERAKSDWGGPNDRRKKLHRASSNRAHTPRRE